MTENHTKLCSQCEAIRNGGNPVIQRWLAGSDEWPKKGYKMNIVILDNDASILRSLSRLLKQRGHSVFTTSSPLNVMLAANTGWPQALICDWDLGQHWPKGHKIIDSVKHLYSIRCILYTGSANYRVGYKKPDAVVKKGDLEGLFSALEL